MEMLLKSRCSSWRNCDGVARGYRTGSSQVEITNGRTAHGARDVVMFVVVRGARPQRRQGMFGDQGKRRGMVAIVMGLSGYDSCKPGSQ